MKKTVIITLSLLITVSVIFGAYNLGTKHSSTSDNNQSESTKSVTSSVMSQSKNISSSTSLKNAETSSDYDPNQTASGVTVDRSMITKVSEELKQAGLPVDEWAPSDIKSIITQASQQGVSPVDYAKQNYHQ